MCELESINKRTKINKGLRKQQQDMNLKVISSYFSDFQPTSSKRRIHIQRKEMIKNEGSIGTRYEISTTDSDLNTGYTTDDDEGKILFL